VLGRIKSAKGEEKGDRKKTERQKGKSSLEAGIKKARKPERGKMLPFSGFRRVIY
jgi:hypothetical protein